MSIFDRVLARLQGKKPADRGETAIGGAAKDSISSLVEVANKSPRLRSTLSTLGNRHGGAAISRIAGPTLCAIGRCMSVKGEWIGFADLHDHRLGRLGFSEADADAVRFLHVAAGRIGNEVALVDLDSNEIEFISSGTGEFKKELRLSDSDVAIIQDAVRTFFGLKEGRITARLGRAWR